MSTTDPERIPDAATRILQASARLFAEGGAARFNLQEVAESASVSKGLIHYHYHDRDTLLARLIEMLSSSIVSRERRAMAGATPATAIDDMWSWLSGELRRGQLRTLQELAQEPGALVRGAVLASAILRREAATETVSRLFDLLDLHLRVPPVLLASVVVAFNDGVVLHAAVAPDQDPRVVFDVFWLGMLEVAE